MLYFPSLELIVKMVKYYLYLSNVVLLSPLEC